MTPVAIQILLKQWTGVDNFEAIEASTIEQYLLEYPFSPGLQLLLTKKYQSEASAPYTAQLKKTNAFFPSTLQLHQWIQESDEFEINPASQKLTSIISAQLAQFQEPLKDEKLVFEQDVQPTLQKDYFGAQGIEIDLSKIPQDKFTQQLKSFTAWLKVLKQTDEGHIAPEIAVEQEKVIAAIAEKANKAEDIITESMAEIWVKQGNKRKAIDTYSKLSFIFPEKSVYFASRIEQLKQKK